MANKDMRTCSMSLGSSRKYKSKPLERLKLKAAISNSGADVEEIKISYIANSSVK